MIKMKSWNACRKNICTHVCTYDNRISNSSRTCLISNYRGKLLITWSFGQVPINIPISFTTAQRRPLCVAGIRGYSNMHSELCVNDNIVDSLFTLSEGLWSHFGPEATEEGAKCGEQGSAVAQWEEARVGGKGKWDAAPGEAAADIWQFFVTLREWLPTTLCEVNNH